MIKMVVFDMAGTVVDEQNIVYKTLYKGISEAGFSTDLETVLLHGAGKDKLQAIIDVMTHLDGKADRDLARSIHRQFKENLAEAYRVLEVLPQPGTNETFQKLRAAGIKVVLNTGYDRATALSLIEKLNWKIDRDIDALVTASDVENGRPAPDMITRAMDQFGIADGGQVAKVGDSIIDIEEGQNADCKYTFGVTTGAHTRAQLLSAKPSYVIDRLVEILTIVVP